MYLVIAETYALTASFRNSEDHTYQGTLPLPPITTLTGILGAALGLSFPEAVRYRDEQLLKIGVYGYAAGQMRDLWKYRRIKAKKNDADDNKEGVLIRNYLVDFTMNLFIGCPNKDVAQTVSAALVNPYYALTAGNSDDLLKIKRVYIKENIVEQDQTLFSHTIVPGDHRLATSTIVLQEQPITYTLQAPVVAMLPTEFSFEGEARRVKHRELFTFVGSLIRVAKPLLAVSVNDVSVPLL
jgi:CRISPR-associated protein Cas5t